MFPPLTEPDLHRIASPVISTNQPISNQETSVVLACSAPSRDYIATKITNKQKETFFLNSQNKQNSLFKLALNEDIFEVKIHYYKKKSVLKNGVKIAEFNDGFLESKEENTSNLLVTDITDLEIVFLLYTCLKTGVTNQKPLIKSQKELISIKEDWGA